MSVGLLRFCIHFLNFCLDKINAVIKTILNVKLEYGFMAMHYLVAVIFKKIVTKYGPKNPHLIMSEKVVCTVIVFVIQKTLGN